MLRLSEVALFLTPLLIFGLWLVAGRRLARLAWPVVGLAVLAAVALIAFGLTRSLPRGAPYVPAQLHDGRVIEGHGG